ncbi:MAG TPA: hypothetical protein VIY30_01695, partial [Burkholderiaceae bacterium]
MQEDARSGGAPFQRSNRLLKNEIRCALSLLASIANTAHELLRLGMRRPASPQWSARIAPRY